MSKYHRAHAFIAALAALTIALVVAVTMSTGLVTTRIPLWKVTSTQRTLYVTGAMGIPLNARPVPKRTAQAFAQSGMLVMEGDIGRPDAKAKIKALMKKYEPIPGGRTLADELTDTQLRRVKMVLADVGVDYNDVQHDQPWAVVIHFAHAAEKKSGRKPDAGQRYRYFEHLAKQRHMPVVPLDSFKQEIEMVANMPAKLQVADLMQAMNGALHPQAALQNNQGTRKAWSAGDMPSAAKYFDANFKDYPGLYQVIDTSRHNRWAKTLATMLAKSGKPVFVVVGAPHLFGPDNLFDHLRNAGFTVTQL